MNTLHDIPLIPNNGMTLDRYQEAAGPVFERIAHDIDDGWLDLQDKGRYLRRLTSAEFDPALRELDPGIVGAKFVDGEVTDLEQIATDYVSRSKDAAEVHRLTHVMALGAQGLLAEAAKSWIRSHESAICLHLAEDRDAIAGQAHRLAPLLQSVESPTDLVAHPTAAVAYGEAIVLLKQWDVLRRLHTAVTGINPNDRSTLWRGLDWVGNYVQAWPGYFLANGIRDELNRYTREPEPVPWETESPTARIRELARVTVWTPTAAEFNAAKLQLDRTAHAARKEFRETPTSAPRTEIIKTGENPVMKSFESVGDFR